LFVAELILALVDLNQKDKYFFFSLCILIIGNIQFLWWLLGKLYLLLGNSLPL